MNYTAATTPSNQTPCTNVPVHCTLCAPGLRGQPQSFWKYNLIHHMSIHHLTKMSELPSLDPALVFTTWITKREEAAMGIEPMKTKLHRTNHFKNLDSDGLEVIYQGYIKEQQRKRAMSSVSQASQTSASRNPSPSKRGRAT